jgi:transcriptional regulator with XRE-family HTH domain
MAKADLRKPEPPNDVGAAIARAQQLRGWTLKEFADALDRDERQLARWIAGTEHPQLDTLFALVSFRHALIVALAEQAGLGVDVQTVITLRTAA